MEAMLMESEGDKILGIWVGEIMGITFRFEFFKDGENIYGGKIIDIKIPLLLKPFVGAIRMNPEEVKNAKLFSFSYDPSKDAFTIDSFNMDLPRKANKTLPTLPKGMNLQAEQISSENMVLRYRGRGMNRTLKLVRDTGNNPLLH